MPRPRFSLRNESEYFLIDFTFPTASGLERMGRGAQTEYGTWFQFFGYGGHEFPASRKIGYFVVMIAVFLEIAEVQKKMPSPAFSDGSHPALRFHFPERGALPRQLVA